MLLFVEAAYIRSGVNVFSDTTSLEVRKAEIVADTERMALYDADKIPIFDTIATFNDYGVMEISVPENTHYTSVCFLGTTNVNRVCQILTAEVAL